MAACPVDDSMCIGHDTPRAMDAEGAGFPTGDALCVVLSFLTYHDVVACKLRAVCSEWERALRTCAHAWAPRVRVADVPGKRTFDLARMPHQGGWKRVLETCVVSTAAPVPRFAWWKVREMNLTRCSWMGDDCMPRIAEFKLRMLCVPTAVTDAGLACLASMTTLEKLSLCDCGRVTGTSFGVLRHLPLRALDITHTDVTDKAMADVAAFPLEDLRMACCERLSLFGFMRLQGARLTVLNASSNSWLRDMALVALRGMPMRRLSLAHCDVTGDGLRYLADSSLERLDLSGTEVSDDTLALIPRSHLRVLALQVCRLITPHGLLSLTGAPLVHLDLSMCRWIDVRVFHCLRVFPTLVSVDVRFTAVGLSDMPVGPVHSRASKNSRETGVIGEFPSVM
jgi:Leucine Rich repeat